MIPLFCSEVTLTVVFHFVFLVVIVIVILSVSIIWAVEMSEKMETVRK